eukprot:5297411-Pyramimonas_sp.AAC.1
MPESTLMFHDFGWSRGHPDNAVRVHVFVRAILNASAAHTYLSASQGPTLTFPMTRHEPPR